MQSKAHETEAVTHLRIHFHARLHFRESRDALKVANSAVAASTVNSISAEDCAQASLQAGGCLLC